MSKDLNVYVSRWNDLQSRRDGIEIEYANYARELRAKFRTDSPKGTLEGDTEFKAWCVEHLESCNEATAAMLLFKAIAIALCKTPDNWKLIGGERGVHAIGMLTSRGQAIEWIETALREKRHLRSVVNAHKPTRTPVDRERPALDATKFAKFIAALAHTGMVPADLLADVKRYVRLPAAPKPRGTAKNKAPRATA